MRTGVQNVPPSGQLPIPGGLAARFQLLGGGYKDVQGHSLPFAPDLANNRLATLILSDQSGRVNLQFSDNGIQALPKGITQWNLNVVPISNAILGGPPSSPGDFSIAWKIFDSVEELLYEKPGSPVDTNGNVPTAENKRWRLILDTGLIDVHVTPRVFGPFDFSDCHEVIAFCEAGNIAVAVSMYPSTPFTGVGDGANPFAVSSGAANPGFLFSNGISGANPGTNIPQAPSPSMFFSVGNAGGAVAQRYSVFGR